MNMERFYRFAGVEIAVSVPDEIEYRDERLLAAFRTESAIDPHRFLFKIVEALSSPKYPLVSRQGSYVVYGDGETQIRFIGAQSDPHMRVLHRGKDHRVQLKKCSYPSGVTAKTVLNALALEHLAAQNRGFVFHCSYIEHNGKAILFTAPSGTGKSTQAELWKKHRGAQIINGDRAVIRVDEENILACGIPFAGSSVYCENRTLPIVAIVYLSQAPQTTIRKMRGYEAFSKIWEGVSVNTWDKADMERVSEVAQLTASQIPVYHLACTPDESAVIALEQVLKAGE